MSESGKFKKKPVVIDAMHWSGLSEDAFALGEWWRSFGGPDAQQEAFWFDANKQLVIVTLEDGKSGEAKHVASPGDWIIRGTHGEFYPIKPDIFAANYERAEFGDE